MSTKPKSYAALTREVDRLQAQVDELKGQVSKHFAVYRDLAGEVIDLRTQRDQVVRILTGADE